MGHWDDNLEAAADNLRLFEPETGWRSYRDVTDDQGRISEHGANRSVELALSIALNSTNLVLLTGAGSSFAARNSAEGAQQAPGMSDLWDAVVASVPKDKFDQILALIPKSKTFGKNVEKLLTQCKLYVELFENEESKLLSGFISDAERAISKRVDFVDESTDLSAQASLVRKLARRGVRKPRAKIFTTNYDLCFEVAARSQRFTVIDGFSHSLPQVYDRGHFSHDVVRRESGKGAPDYVESVFQFYKLHGSLDWRRTTSGIIRSRDDSLGPPLLIYPRDSKYQETFDPPYLDMMGAFQSTLREPDTALIISGFGFNDDHISRPLMAALEANMTLRLIVCDVAFIDDEALDSNSHMIPKDTPLRPQASAYFDKFKKLVSIGDQRITLLNGRFQDLAFAMPDLVAQTERERHAERLQILHDVAEKTV